jgi:hypothetical protein
VKHFADTIGYDEETLSTVSTIYAIRVAHRLVNVFLSAQKTSIIPKLTTRDERPLKWTMHDDTIIILNSQLQQVIVLFHCLSCLPTIFL